MTDPQLDHLLKTAAGSPAVPPTFASDVWQRIHAQEPARRNSFAGAASAWREKAHVLWASLLHRPLGVGLITTTAGLLLTGALFLSRPAGRPLTSQTQAEPPVLSHQDTPANLAWMRTALSLTDEEFARECAQHDSHRAECSLLCSRLSEARAQLQQVLQTHGHDTHGGQELIRSHQLHLQACEQTAVQQVKKVTEALNPQAAQAYVRQMLPDLALNDDTLKTFTSTRRQP